MKNKDSIIIILVFYGIITSIFLYLKLTTKVNKDIEIENSSLKEYLRIAKDCNLSPTQKQEVELILLNK